VTGLAVKAIATNRDTTRMASPPATLQTFNERACSAREQDGRQPKPRLVIVRIANRLGFQLIGDKLVAL